MRRRLDILAIVLLAMWVQLLAPIAGLGMLAHAASDPLRMSEICHGAPSQDDTQNNPADPQNGATCCAICSIGNGGHLALDPPVPAFVRLHLDFVKLSWRDAADPVAVATTGSHAQARAPPSLS